MDQNGTSHGRRSSLVTVARMMTPFATVMLLFYQMITSSESDQVGIVGRSGNRYTAGTANVGVAQLIC